MASRARLSPPEAAALPADVAAVLDGQPPAVARTAAAALAAALATRTGGDGAIDIGGSLLTGDGFPVEFGVAGDDPRLRVTVEPGPRSLAPADRTALAADLVAAIGGDGIDPATLARIRRVQSAPGLRYGAWLGTRHGEDGGVEAKLYLELPPGSDPDWPRPPLGRRAMTARMVACAPDGAWEIYWRIPSLRPGELAAVLAPAGLEDEAPALLDWLADAYGHPLGERLPGPDTGVSYVGGRVTLFLTARALWGPDATIRRRFVALAGSGAPLLRYLSATRPFAERRDWATRHGMVAITPRRGAAPAIGIGYRPVAP